MNNAFSSAVFVLVKERSAQFELVQIVFFSIASYPVPPFSFYPSSHMCILAPQHP